MFYLSLACVNCVMFLSCIVYVMYSLLAAPLARAPLQKRCLSQWDFPG